MRHGGSIVAETLLQHDVKFIFTLCGGHISPILVACSEKGIRVVDVRHEATAVLLQMLYRVYPQQLVWPQLQRVQD